MWDQKCLIWVLVTKTVLFGYFLAGIWKKCQIWNQRLWFCLAPHIWDQKCLIWVSLGWNLKMILLYLKSVHSILSNCKISWKNENVKIWDQKCLIWPRTLKNYCHIWNQHPRIFITAKFCAKTKMPTFGTKIPYLGVFGPEL